MRVIAGMLKGRRLEAPGWSGLRPTGDKLRETLFNILAPRIEGACVLDGFAGTGAVGIEALSRGAAHVTFVDADRRAVALIGRNLSRCAIDGAFSVHHGDVAAVLRRLPAEDDFDLVVLDPPYDAPDVTGVLDAAAARLRPDGLVVLERATRREPDIPASLHRVRDVASGDSALTFFERGI
ncbi:MAG: 16S rRNA (guanine(966)-N(2))-methyltransferase RsmD [Vicinamibacterales bacterium]